MKRSIKSYAEELAKVYEGDPWYGKPIKSLLQEVKAEDAFKNGHAKHSIYQIVNHMLAWRELLLKRLNGDSKATIKLNSEQDWAPNPPKADIQNWKDVIERLQKNQEGLLKNLKSRSDDDLSNELAESGATLDMHLDGLLQHDIYHAGQVGLLKDSNV